MRLLRGQKPTPLKTTTQKPPHYKTFDRITGPFLNLNEIDPFLQSKFVLVIFRLEDESRELRDRLAASERQIRELELKNETDAEMYLKMLADTRRIFAQGLKHNLESNPIGEHWTEKVTSSKPQ